MNVWNKLNSTFYVAYPLVHLVGIDAFGMTNDGGGAKYQGVKASFCKLDWEQYKANPPLLPMFRVLVIEILYMNIP